MLGTLYHIVIAQESKLHKSSKEIAEVGIWVIHDQNLNMTTPISGCWHVSWYSYSPRVVPLSLLLLRKMISGC